MFRHKINISIIISICFYSYILCIRPDCDKRCCDERKAYNEKARNRGLCTLKCYLCYVLSTVYKSKIDNSMIIPLCNSSNNETLEYLDKCLLRCGEIPPRGCEKQCCDQRDMIERGRKKDPNACCDGHKSVTIHDLNEEDVIDCRTSSPSCDNKGFLIMYSDNSTVCIPEDSRNSDLGHQFGYSDECWKLEGYGVDPEDNYWKEL